MSKEIRAHLYDELVAENFELNEEFKKLRDAVLSICDKYVSLGFYAAARAEIDKIYKKNTEGRINV